MKIIAFLLSFFVVMECYASSVGEAAPCHYEKSQIVAYEWTNNYKRLSYRTADGRSVLIAEAIKGDALTGIFKGNVQRKDVITNRWVDISEVKFLDPSFDKYEVLNFKIVYLPMNYELTSKDLDLNDDWKIFAYWFDYDRHKTTYDEKVWQFAVKNKKTGRTNTFIASDIEKKLLAKCGINSDKKGDRSQRQDNQAQ
jgi:hypothetical protein